MTVKVEHLVKQELKKTENHDIFMSFQYLNKRIDEEKLER